MRKSISRIVSLCLALALSLSVSVTGLAANFSDVSGHWAESVIVHMADKGAISGYEDGTFKPNNSITRAETVVVLQNLFNFTPVMTGEFKDVDTSSWYANAVYAMKAQGIVSGLQSDKFGPSINISRQDVSVIVARLYGIDADKNYATNFVDSDKIASYATNAVGFLVEAEVLKGRDGNMFAPTANVTRAEFMQILYMADQKLTANELTAVDEKVDPVEDKSMTKPLGGNSSSGGGSGSGGSGNQGNQTQDVFSVENSGIVAVDEIYYAVLTFKEVPSGYTYKVSGNDVTADVTNVNRAGNIVKIQFPDDSARTISVWKDGKMVSALELKEIGESKAVGAEVITGFTVENTEPYLVLAEEELSLEQYLKFITVGQAGTIYVKPSDTTVNSTMTFAMGIDAVSSATQQVPQDFENIKVDAVIAVQFDMIANNVIADALGIPTSGTADLLDKWASLDKGIVLNEDFTLYADELGDVINKDISGATLPKYIKYLTSSAQYGTKVYFSTHQPDSQIPPTIADIKVLNSTDAVLTLSEENETWYLYLTEISIPYTSSGPIYQYLDESELSADGLTLTLKKGALGPMTYSSDYEITLKAFEFDDVKVQMSVLDAAPGLWAGQEIAWEDANGRVNIRFTDSYYLNGLEKLWVNGVLLGANDGIETNAARLYIPYKYLVEGANEIVIECAGYFDNTITFDSPAGFTVPKLAPAFTVGEMLTGTTVLKLTYESLGMPSDEQGWIDGLAKEHITGNQSYFNYTSANVNKGTDEIEITFNSSFLTSGITTVTIAVPGYEVVKFGVKPVKAVPTLTQSWTVENSFTLVTTDSSYFGTGTVLLLDGKTLERDLDYKILSSYPNYTAEVYAHNFKTNSIHVLEVVSNDYAKNSVSAVTDSSFVESIDAPVLLAEESVVSQTVSIGFSDDTDWANNLTKVTVKRGTSTESTVSGYSTASGELVIPASYFTSSGIYTITCYATGYYIVQIVVEVVKEDTLALVINNSEARLEFTSKTSTGSNDTYFYDYAVVYLNGVKLTKNTDYTIKSYHTMYIDASYFNEDENILVVEAPGYKKVIETVAKQEVPKDVPEIEFNEAMFRGENVFVLKVDDQDWIDAVVAGTNSVSITYGYSTTLIVDDVNDMGSGLLEITARQNVTIREYTVTIVAEGYRKATFVFTPYTQTPEITYSWSGNDLIITAVGDSSFIGYSAPEVKLNGETLISGTSNDYRTESVSSGYAIRIYERALDKTEAPYEIEVTNKDTSYNYNGSVTIIAD